jgi:caa(3)-type oxidase subunit IV
MTAATDSHAHAHADHSHGGHDHGGHDHGEHEHIHPPIYYVKIWALLLVLMVLSLIGSEVPNHFVVLMAAFGIALVKAYLVCAKFMHLNIEKKFVIYFLVTSLAFMALFYFGIAPDVMKHEGHRWKNVAAEAAVQRGLVEAQAGGGHGGSGHAEHGGGDHGAAAKPAH